MSEPGSIEVAQVPTSPEAKQAIPHAFVNSELAKARDSQRVSGKPFSVLFADIDNTYYRPDRKDVSGKLSDIAKENNVPIVAVTGNGFKHVLERISKGELPHFPAIAGLVGTEIWVLHKDENGLMEYVKDDGYEKSILEKGFDRKALVVLANDTITNFETEHPSWGFVFQHPEVEASYLKGEQVEVEQFKISFFSYSSSEEDVGQMSSEMQSKFPNQKVVISEDAVYGQSSKEGAPPKRYCIDILPATKADAVKYICDKMEVDIAGVAGDSGNDIDMLTDSGDISIKVGGSKPELDKVVNDVWIKGEGKGSFRKVTDKDGKVTTYYKERDPQRLGPESILYAGEVLRRAQRRFGKKNPNT